MKQTSVGGNHFSYFHIRGSYEIQSIKEEKEVEKLKKYVYIETIFTRQIQKIKLVTHITRTIKMSNVNSHFLSGASSQSRCSDIAWEISGSAITDKHISIFYRTGHCISIEKILQVREEFFLM